MLAFAISRTNLVGKKVYAMLCLIPMYFGGGLMPTYFLILNLGLKNNFLVYIIPALVNLWNMILMRSYFQSLPEALEESALIDGANYITIFFKIYRSSRRSPCTSVCSIGTTGSRQTCTLHRIT